MKIELDRRFARKLKGRFGKYDFQVGVLDNKPHRLPTADLEIQNGKVRYATKKYKGENVFTEKKLVKYAGGWTRQASRKDSGKTIAEVSAANRKRLGFNYLTEPFKGKNHSKDIIRFSREFFKLAFGKSEKRRAENLLQAIIRNPILRGEYLSPNSKLTQKIKGFDRGMIDTAQLFKNLKAVCKVRGK